MQDYRGIIAHKDWIHVVLNDKTWMNGNLHTKGKLLKRIEIVQITSHKVQMGLYSMFVTEKKIGLTLHLNFSQYSHHDL